MKKTGFLFDKRFMLHKTSSFHPEIPKRLSAIYKGIEQSGLIPELFLIKGEKAELKWIETVHNKNYIKNFKDACIKGKETFQSPDNQICSDSYETALLAVGGIIKTLDLVMENTINNAFCAVRPPGHHAEKERAIGFCYFNNIAIAAKYLQIKWNIKNIGIIDFDVHHGNGTQNIFERDPTVFYYSIHEHPSFAFPGTGREFEYGEEKGYGFTLNSPVLPGKGDSEYMELIKNDMIPGFERFKPEIILVSTGFDAHMDDEMSDIMLSTKCFSWIMEQIIKIADKYSNSRLVSILEGGYCLKRLPELAKDHVSIMVNG